jgi:hypothetical protein
MERSYFVHIFVPHYFSIIPSTHKLTTLVLRKRERATGWTIGVLGFDSRRGLGIFLFTTVSKTALGPTQPLIQWVPEALSLGIKRPGREADQ